MAMKKCPVCGASVKLENLERHVKNQHPRAKVDPEALLTDEEQVQVEKAKDAGRPGLTASGKRMIIILTVVVAVVLVAAVLLTTIRLGGAQVGQVAPNFTLNTTAGVPVTLTDYRGHVVLLEFMNTLCPNCQNEAPTLAQLYNSFGSRVRFLSIDIAVGSEFAVNTAAQINAFKQQYNTTWDYVIDANNGVATSYGVTGTPTSFILDSSGVVRTIYVGTHTYNDFASALNTALG